MGSGGWPGSPRGELTEPAGRRAELSPVRAVADIAQLQSASAAATVSLAREAAGKWRRGDMTGPQTAAPPSTQRTESRQAGLRQANLALLILLAVQFAL